MAADAPLPVAATAVARHVRECDACSGFVDELERVRRWLARVPLPQTLARRSGGLAGMARAALSRELLARFARDLVGASRGALRRPATERTRDAGRLVATTQGLSHGPGVSREDAACVDLALRDGPVEPGLALEAAVRLDPLGLDVALAWLGCLERSGRGALAQRITDRMLARLA